MTYHVPQHKQPQTLKEAIDYDRERREAAYQEYLTTKKRYQELEQAAKTQRAVEAQNERSE